MGTAVVTGGTSGIGAAFARALARRGWDLVLVARDEVRLQAMADELRALGRHVELLPADLAVRGDVDRVAARIEDADRPIGMLVNNAGFSVHTTLSSRNVDAHDGAIDVMIRAVLVLGGAAARAMRPRGEGAILNVSSTAGYITMGAYSAIKAWVTAYTEGLANELHGSGVRVTALCPGWVHTEFHARAGIPEASIPNSLWLDAEPLVETALRDNERGRVISIPSVRYGALIWLARHAPRGAIRAISRRFSSRRRDSLTE